MKKLFNARSNGAYYLVTLLILLLSLGTYFGTRKLGNENPSTVDSTGVAMTVVDTLAVKADTLVTTVDTITVK